MVGKIITKSVPPLRYIGLVVTTLQGVLYLVILIRQLKQDKEYRKPVKKPFKRKL